MPVPGTEGTDDAARRPSRRREARPPRALQGPPLAAASAATTLRAAASPAAGDSAGAATFAALGVPAPLVGALTAAGIHTPFPIQAAVLPDALAGSDILGRGRTGSGKTLGFSIPLVARLADGYTSAGRPRGLVLVPTRELASQVQEVLVPLARAVGLSVSTIFGGTSQRPQVAALHGRVDIVVACPWPPGRPDRAGSLPPR